MEIVYLINRRGRVINVDTKEAERLLNQHSTEGKSLYRRIEDPKQRYYPEYDELVVPQSDKKIVGKNVVDTTLKIKVL